MIEQIRYALAQPQEPLEKLSTCLVYARLLEAEGSADKALPIYDAVSRAPFDKLAAPALLRATQIRLYAGKLSPDKAAALAAMRRALRPGGQLLVLEFSHPRAPGLKPLYDAYSFRILPWLGRVVAGDEASYRYLAESIRMHPDQEALLKMLQQAGLEGCRYHNLSGGIVAVHRGYKS